ncbi:MAG: hypothetical protein M9955_13220 [Rhizobiaceae bacterium]|nr:hypothetical protein [Rhizobiaceae bacterium]
MAKRPKLSLVQTDPRIAPPKPDIVTEDTAALAFTEKFRDRLLYCHDTGACLRRMPMRMPTHIPALLAGMLLNRGVESLAPVPWLLERFLLTN